MTEDDKREVALKYLDLARGEILEKTRFVNQTLGSYLIGSAALASWLYQAVYKPVDKGTAAATGLQQASAAVAFALMMAYLGFAVNWIIDHNERIIAALAIYQRDCLSPVLVDDPPMWERSPTLARLDDLAKALKMVLVEELIVLGPPVAALVFAFLQALPQIQAANCTTRLVAGGSLAAALAANVKTAQIGGQMYQTKRNLRS